MVNNIFRVNHIKRAKCITKVDYLNQIEKQQTECIAEPATIRRKNSKSLNSFLSGWESLNVSFIKSYILNIIFAIRYTM